MYICLYSVWALAGADRFMRSELLLIIKGFILLFKEPVRKFNLIIFPQCKTTQTILLFLLTTLQLLPEQDKHWSSTTVSLMTHQSHTDLGKTGRVKGRDFTTWEHRHVVYMGIAFSTKKLLGELYTEIYIFWWEYCGDQLHQLHKPYLTPYWVLNMPWSQRKEIALVMLPELKMLL